MDITQQYDLASPMFYIRCGGSWHHAQLLRIKKMPYLYRVNYIDLRMTTTETFYLIPIENMTVSSSPMLASSTSSPPRCSAFNGTNFQLKGSDHRTLLTRNNNNNDNNKNNKRPREELDLSKKNKVFKKETSVDVTNTAIEPLSSQERVDTRNLLAREMADAINSMAVDRPHPACSDTLAAFDMFVNYNGVNLWDFMKCRRVAKERKIDVIFLMASLLVHRMSPDWVRTELSRIRKENGGVLFREHKPKEETTTSKETEATNAMEIEDIAIEKEIEEDIVIEKKQIQAIDAMEIDDY